MTYQEHLRSHLVKYKFRVLGVTANAAWKGPRTGAVAEQPHILPPEHARLNILAPYRSRFWQEFDRGEGHELHRDFAHLNSSQAMCFNLFYPLTVDREFAAACFRSVLGVKEAPRRLAFEYVHDPAEGTRFDFVAELDSGARVYFETRLAELGFGTVDLPSRERLNLLARNAARLAGAERPASSLYLVVPRANESLQQALATLPEIAAGALQERVRVLYLEEALERLKPLLRGRDEALKQHYREFRDKYLPPDEHRAAMRRL